MENFPTQPKSINQIEPIGLSRGSLIKNREKLTEVVEAPLLGACKILYDKNIETTESTANSNDIKAGRAGIVINYDSLSEENKKIAQENCEISNHPDGHTAAEIKILINENSTVEEIGREAEEIANKFEKQKLIWSPTFTLEQIKNLYGIAQEEDYPPEMFYQFYYDPQTQLFYVSEEHFHKITDNS